MKWLKRLLLVLAFALLLLAGFVVPTVWFKPWKIDHFYMRVLVEALFDDPLLLTQLKLLESVGLTFHADDLPDQSLAQRDKVAERAHRNMKLLESYGRDSLSVEQQVSYDLMHWMLASQIEESDHFRKHPYAFDQVFGLPMRFPDVMVGYHNIAKRSDAEDYLTRVRKIGPAFDDLLLKTSQLEKDGFTIPRFILLKVATDVRDFAAKPVGENALHVDMEKKLAQASAIDAADKKALLEALDKVLLEIAIPAYCRLADGLGDAASRASDDAGVWHLPDGDAWYAHQVREMTTTTMSPAELHQLGLSEVARLQAEITAIWDAQAVATSTGAFGDRFKKFSRDPKWFYSDDDAGRKAILDRYGEILKEMEAKLDGVAPSNPKKPLDVVRIPEFREKTSPFAHYFPPAGDGSKNASFFVNLRDVKEQPKYFMRTLAYHEGVPGHHLQLTVARAQKDLPMFRQLIPLPAYTEGWALYAEDLADENGFERDPFDRIGYLSSLLFRAVRLVVDTGIHYKRWTRQQAVDYVMDNAGMPKGSVETEIDRYCMWPGQALAYMVGRLKMRQLRAHAEQELGPKFQLAAFHDAVLATGALPLDLLSGEIERWIATQKAAGAHP